MGDYGCCPLGSASLRPASPEMGKEVQWVELRRASFTVLQTVFKKNSPCGALRYRLETDMYQTKKSPKKIPIGGFFHSAAADVCSGVRFFFFS